MSKKRIISSVFLIAVTVFGVLIDWFFATLVIFLIALGLYEFFTLIERKGIKIYKYFGIGVGLFIPLSIYHHFELTRGWELLFIVSLLLIIFLMQFARHDNRGAVEGISTLLFGVLYISWLFSFIIKIRYLQLEQNFLQTSGINLIAALLLITKSGDIGAYLVGTRFGKHPLIAWVSPKKSVEGAFGGFVFSIFAAIASKIFIPGLSYMHLALIGFALGVLGQLGDLSESLIKRDCQIKDSGAIFPGMGGVMDIIDSLLFTAPAFYFYMSFLINKTL